MADIFQDDFRDFIKVLNDNDVDYLLVGGFAVILYGHARVTGDMDIWVERSEQNFNKLVKAFHQFHMPLFDMTKENFLNHKDWDVFKYGRKPVAIDIMTRVKGLDFAECYKIAREFEDGEIKIKTLHLNHLLQAKKAAGRLKDLDDIEQLTKE
jgi:hypothetical protein